MDRRQRKTRTAIFEAFISLLDQSSYGHITVGQIIDRADVGRATFYAHFETKDHLLKALCEELFCHVSDGGSHNHIFSCQGEESAFLHLLRHLYKDDHHILRLLSGRNNGLFWEYFQEELKVLVQSQLALFAEKKDPRLPDSLWQDHIAATFVQILKWWMENDRRESPETVADYFFLLV